MASCYEIPERQSPGVHEDDLNIENDKEDRRQVELYRNFGIPFDLYRNTALITFELHRVVGSWACLGSHPQQKTPEQNHEGRQEEDST